MKVLIDADACPVWRVAVKICNELQTEYVLVCDVSHQFKEEFNVIYVDGGADAADYKIVALTNKNDIVITQDYGLATMVLSKEGNVINQNGMIYDDRNIMTLLESRAFNQKMRKHKVHLKGPKKRTEDQNVSFADSFTNLIKKVQSNISS
ncbi:MAG: YaiI/YqxD family protein [bacterium]